MVFLVNKKTTCKVVVGEKGKKGKLYLCIGWTNPKCTYFVSFLLNIKYQNLLRYTSIGTICCRASVTIRMF